MASSSDLGQRYTLTVQNKNSRFQQFALFQTLPNIVAPSTNPVSLAWMLGATAPGTPTNPAMSVFTWEILYSATTGYFQNLDDSTTPRTFATATNAAVEVDTLNSLNVQYQGTFPQGAPWFPGGPTDGVPGLITVQSDNSLPNSLQQQSQNMSINLGISMNNKPTVAVQLLPNLLYQFTPKPNYFILAGSFAQGQVIDTATTTQAFQIEYEGITDRTIVFTEQNQFESA